MGGDGGACRDFRGRDARFEPGLGACTGASGGPRAPPEASVISKLHHRPALQSDGAGRYCFIRP